MIYQINDDRKYIEIPGDNKFELPPFSVAKKFVFNPHKDDSLIKTFNVQAAEMIPNNDLISNPYMVGKPNQILLGARLAESYVDFYNKWFLGNKLFEWFEECKITFQLNSNLKRIISHDFWPANVPIDLTNVYELNCGNYTGQIARIAVGLRYNFLKLPPANCVSPLFLSDFDKLGLSTFREMEGLIKERIPPDRFYFQSAVI